MTQPAGHEERRRETRLLVTTVVVSVAMLFLLARFRFPSQPQPAAIVAPAAPLERLAARATYDDLSRVMAELEQRVVPTIALVPVVDEGRAVYLPAPMMTPDKAVAVISRDARVRSVEGTPEPRVIARDPIRQVAVLDVSGRAGIVAAEAASSRPGPRYVAVVEGTALGPVLRPLYVGRIDLFADPRWTDPVLSIPAVQSVQPGTAIFSLDGALIGLVSANAGVATVIPASALRAVADAAATAPAVHSTLGIAVQPLTPALARGAGASRGVMVSDVRDPGTSNAALRPGDVIDSIDGIGITTVTGFDEIAGSRTPDAPVEIVRVRAGQRATVTITALAADAPSASTDFGAALQSIRGVGVQVATIHSGGAAAMGGLHTGDVVVAINGESTDDGARIRRAFGALDHGGVLLLTVRNDGRQRIVGVTRQ